MSNSALPRALVSFACSPNTDIILKKESESEYNDSSCCIKGITDVDLSTAVCNLPAT